MIKVQTACLFKELQKMRIKAPKLIDGCYVVDDEFFIVAMYYTPFNDENAYWILWQKKQPLPSHKRDRALTLTESGLFTYALVEPTSRCRNKIIQTYFM
ncbi:hypothetical protein C3463_07385 [Serratia marcescens]|uniref:hypothetical protein n=1 Tax=Serratia marcescens TaxID=615 RepID=UPI000CDD4E77|nr:hypothetical protein [Serratia marcescens]POX30802.1 hypothetical protein C3463_07385 [Serratia marcescens]